jgi:hypothetical protein
VESPHALLERGLAPRAPGVAFETSLVRWYGVADLDTRAAAIALGRSSWRVALGASQTGTTELGWQALALAIGHATEDAGIAVRVLGRREPAALSETPLGKGVGLDAGAGAWVRAADGVRVWASAPQAWSRGAAPPLRRPLAIGASAELAGVVAWLERTAPARADDALGSHALGLALRAERAAAWCELLDRPMRASLGIEARVGALTASARVDDHPALGDAVRLSLRWGGVRP